LEVRHTRPMEATKKIEVVTRRRRHYHLFVAFKLVIVGPGTL
jgi:hypothetical protein